MILVGIDVAKDKHECFIRTLESTVLHKPFSITNNLENFEELYSKICSCNSSEIKVELDVTRHILFPELDTAVSTLYLTCIYKMLLKYPNAKDIAKSRFVH